MRKSDNTTLRGIAIMIRIDMTIFVFPMPIFKSFVTHKFFRLINVGTVMKFSDRYLTINVMLGG